MRTYEFHADRRSTTTPASPGVSKSLVSLVLRGADGVSEASREAVGRAIRKLDYRPSRAASDLAAARTMIVGVLIDDYANPWFVDLLRGLARRARRRRVSAERGDAATTAHAADPVETLLSMRADGIVVARECPVLLGANVPPFVIAGTRAEIPPALTRSATTTSAGREWPPSICSHSATASSATSPWRGRGGCVVPASRRRCGMPGARHRDAVPRPGDRGGRLRGRSALLTEHGEMTAVFAANDVMAIGALGAARSSDSTCRSALRRRLRQHRSRAVADHRSDHRRR